MTFTSTPSSFGEGTVTILSYSSLLIVALNRPHTKNAINDSVYLDLIGCMDMVMHDPTYNGLILTGTGDYFSSGADITASFLQEEGPARSILHAPAGQFMMKCLDFPKLLCAAVNGPAIGIAVTLLLHCDIVWCHSTTTTLWAPFSRLALVPEFGSSITFIDTMGLSKANEMLLLGRKIDARTAVQWNIASQSVATSVVTDPFHYDSVSMKMAREINEKLLVLPRSQQTIQVFIELMRMTRHGHLKKTVTSELIRLDQRMKDGECLEAAMQLNLQRRSKL